MNWKTLEEFRRDKRHYCTRCARNCPLGCTSEKIVLIWNDCVGENGEPVGIDFYCENFAWTSNMVKHSELAKK